MNERIVELAKQCGLWHVTDREDLCRDFAELIVQECVDICDAYGMPDGTSATAMILAAAIRRKFGIEDVDEQLRRRSTYFGNNP
jgi:hypothetical protein